MTFIEQGHIRVGPDTVTDPAYLVTRNMEDYVTWVDTSKLRRTIMEYNDEVSFLSFFPEVLACESNNTDGYIHSSTTSTCYNSVTFSKARFLPILSVTLRTRKVSYHITLAMETI